MSSKSKTVKQITYEVTNAFGDSPIGEQRIAYIIGGLDEGTALAFHPKEGRYLTGSLELVKTKSYRLPDIYQSENPDAFTNLSTAEEKNFRKLVEQELGLIPKNLVLKNPEDEPVPLKKAVKKKLKPH